MIGSDVPKSRSVMALAATSASGLGRVKRVRATVAIDQPRQQLSRESCFTTREPSHLGP